LTADIGHPALPQQIDNVLKIMAGYDDWHSMMRHVNRALPVRVQMPLLDGVEE
jgi:hypothetical protein